MPRQYLYCCALVLMLTQQMFGQASHTLSGYVRDKQSGETLIGAAVISKEMHTGGTANNYGFYSLTLPKGTYTIRIQFIGYKTEELQVELDTNKRMDFLLEQQPTELKEVEIKANGPRNELDKTQMSKVDLPMNQLKQLPALLGEIDILKTIQLLPGVLSGSEGGTSFYVRGGGPDQNLILLDEAPVYNASHLFGFFGIFNPDAINDVELYKGDFPARFGGRLSSVLNVTMKEGNNESYHVSGGIGLIASRLTFEGPIKKGRSSFIISARRTYADIFTRIINKAKEKQAGYTPIPDYYFYDLDAKLNYTLDDKNRLYLSGYFGRDVFNFNRSNFSFDFHWGNATTTARWNHIFTPKLFMNTVATFTNYSYVINNSQNGFNFQVGSHVQDWSGQADLDYVYNPKHYIRFGGITTYHIFGVGRVQVQSSQSGLNVNQNNTLFGTEMGIYGSDDWQISRKWKLNYGLRISGFSSDSFYYGLEPRASMLYKLHRNVTLKLSYAQMKQYIHLVSNSASTLPTDIWYPSNKAILPQTSRQVAFGVTTLLLGDKLTLTDEVYYKWLQQQADYRNGAQLFINSSLDSQFVFGKGWAYGNEIFLQKQEGKFTGWLGYTLSWAFSQFPQINNGETFHPKYDQRHDISLVASYEMTKRLSVSATYVYSSGSLTTLPYGYIFANDIPGSGSYIVPVIDKRNNTRMGYYSRLDLAAVWKFRPKHGTSDLTFSVYNVLNRRNPYLLYVDSSIPASRADLQLPSASTVKQVSLFPIIPSVTYNFRF